MYLTRKIFQRIRLQNYEVCTTKNVLHCVAITKLFGINLFIDSFRALNLDLKKKINYTSNLDLELSAQDDMKEEGGICYP